MLCMPGTILRPFEEDERAMVPGLWFMTDAAGRPYRGLPLLGLCPALRRRCILGLLQDGDLLSGTGGLHHPGSVPTQQEPGISIALKTDAIGLIDCMLSAITSQGWTLLVPEPLERPRKVDDSLVLKQYTMKSKSI